MLARPSFRRIPGASLQVLSLVVAALSLTACSTIKPVPFAANDIKPVNAQDRDDASKDVQALNGALTLDEALARALKYNLDRRTRMMEEALALKQLDTSKLDMLPKLVAQAGYQSRSNDRISQSRNTESGALAPSQFVSQDRSHTLLDLTMSWNLIDYSLGYSASLQQADRVLIASEHRRKAMHLLMQDVRTAYWRAASAQKLREQVSKTLEAAEAAMEDSRQAEAERLRNPVDALRYQRQLLENLRLLEAINQELASANLELAALINAPLGADILIADIPLSPSEPAVLKMPVATMEEVALTQNPDLREQHYNSRIAREEVRRTLTRLFPNVSVNYGYKYDSDHYLVNRDWTETGVQVSFNLFNLFTGDTQMKLAHAGVALADQRRVATQMAVVAQMHLARQQLLNAHKQFLRADAIYTTDLKIAEHMRNREQAQAQSKLDRIGNDVAAILSLLRRYQALAQMQAAENKLLATLGAEPAIGSTSELPLSAIIDQIRDGENLGLTKPASAPEKAGT